MRFNGRNRLIQTPISFPINTPACTEEGSRSKRSPRWSKYWSLYQRLHTIETHPFTNYMDGWISSYFNPLASITGEKVSVMKRRFPGRDNLLWNTDKNERYEELTFLSISAIFPIKNIHAHIAIRREVSHSAFGLISGTVCDENE